MDTTDTAQTMNAPISISFASLESAVSALCQKTFGASLDLRPQPPEPPPVCPPKLLPLPEGAVYLGKGWAGRPGISAWSINIYALARGEGWSRARLQRAAQEWTMTSPNVHYATLIGDDTHRAQPWFDESQVSEELERQNVLLKAELAQKQESWDKAANYRDEVLRLRAELKRADEGRAAAEQKRDELLRWKSEAILADKQIMSIDEYVRNHDEATIGDSVWHLVGKWLQERDYFKRKLSEIKKLIP